ncbi:MAG: hypothetical protein GU343_00865 [Nanoarchaeota archaeon]|jgi:uncharacterized membrane protein HdeD (DUF308 family)|nr:hypothetical protein [Nanoarchaeota archaeon]
MEDWMKESLLGLILLIIGGFLVYYWLGETILVIKGLIGLIILILGVLILWIGYEDIKLNKELKEVQKEFSEENKQEQKQENQNKQ